MILIGYIDVSVSTIALFSETKLTGLLVKHDFSTPSHDRLEDIILEFKQLSEVKKYLLSEKINIAAFGVAGPVEKDEVTGQHVKLTNVSAFERIYSNRLAAYLNIPQVKIFNDMEALAYGLPLLSDNAFTFLSPSTLSSQQQASRVLIAATGNGLGEAILNWNTEQKCYSVIPLEGGHIDFAPRTPNETQLLAFFQKFYSPVSYENILTHNGLEKIYQFITSGCDLLKAKEIIENALLSTNENCVVALKMFLSIYGAKTGNLALQQTGFDKIEIAYIAGEMTRELLPLIVDNIFTDSFKKHNQEKFQTILSQISIKVLTQSNVDIGLEGLAEHVKQFINCSSETDISKAILLNNESNVTSPRIFIGKLREKALIVNMLYPPITQKSWILHFQGQGGLGKTLLLEYAYESSTKNEHFLCVKEPVDFYFSRHEQELGILKSLADNLNQNNIFKNFYLKLNATLQTPDRLQQVREAFIRNYANLPQDHIILLFDTTEKITDSAKKFFTETLLRLKRVKPHTSVIAAGRKPLDFLPDEFVTQQSISSLSKQEVIEYFEDDRIGIQLSPEILDKLYSLSEGKPILIGLFVDWHKNGSEIEELIKYDTPESFKQAMVENIKSLNSPQDAILLMIAHCHRRCNESILTYLSPAYKSHIDTTLKQLRKFSFVKYRHTPNGVESILLHDEVYDLIEKYIWVSIDPVGNLQKNHSTRLANYYLQCIETESDEQEKLTLQKDYLYYQLYAERGKGFQLWQHWMQEAKNPETKEALQQEVKFLSHLPAIKIIYQHYQTEIYYARGQYKQCIELANNLRRESTEEQHQTIYPLLLTSYVNSGEPQQAINLGLDLLSKISSNTLIGELHSVIGYAYRKKANYQETIKHYQLALRFYTKDDLEQIARTENNLGYLLHQLGRDREAFAYCSNALRTRQKLNIPYELGLSYNVLGIIESGSYRQARAVAYFEQALNCFEQAGSERGKGLVYIAYGQMLSEQVDTVRQSAEAELLKAENMLNNAVDIMERTDRSTLIEALYEKGRLLRKQSSFKFKPEGFYQALETLEYAEKLAIENSNIIFSLKIKKDIAITLYLLAKFEKENIEKQETFKKAKDVCLQSIQLIQDEHLPSIYILSRIQRTLASILYEEQAYEEAFMNAANSVITLCQKCENAIDQVDITPAKRELLYSYWQEWLINDMFNPYPLVDKVKYIQYLLQCWQTEISETERISFVIAITGIEKV
ncbi:glucokinase [Beggiatoa leptomitoformis]|uniref:Tetratricopeptide repeat protein n=1 Tax=Beggiatoa leptomitoformis TaxID=288004 RepID=A0A2N9YB95_9GAMM|nr:glucokinase [Beggiatoa leptomitoformis]ALG66895.1 tetratricopeptide repeat protein [Beggiatoa leptomitoformis]AUI67745.1 tetratricopeptide repeat protein [Beggiatoa leptomitoformis]